MGIRITDYVAHIKSRVMESPTGCWEWQGGKQGDGYGVIRYKDKCCLVHRVLFSLTKEPIRSGMFLLHSCDNPICVNPSHLRQGTNTDNMRDKVERGRSFTGNQKGANNGASKLTQCLANSIRKDPRVQHVIAKDYGVCQMTVSLIKQGKIWNYNG